jgi:hypothetical protein
MKQSIFQKFNSPTKGLDRFFAWLIVLALVFFAALPFISTSMASAAPQITSRKATITTSESAATGVNYTFDFTLPSGTAVQSIRFEFCTTPLSTCTHPTGMDNNYTTTSLSGTQTFSEATAFTEYTGADSGTCDDHNNGTPANSTEYCISRSDTDAETAAAKQVTINSITNPTTASNTTVYVRIFLYSDTAFTTLVNEGVVAASVQQQLTVNARVQENLQFCIGTTAIDDATTSTGADCAAISGTTVDVGAIDSTVSISPVDANPNGGNDLNGLAMVRTNANNGTVIVYFSEQETSSGKLKVVGATCSGTSTTDQCFNSQGTTQGTFSGGTENFGMTIGGVNCGSVSAYTCTFASDTYNLRMDAQYEGNTNTAYGTSAGFAWDDTGATDTIASSTSSTVKVLDDEALILRFAATAAATTPTGTYTVTSTYIATPTF